jgi:uncharacterized protein YbjQ (UPF0145 family)
VPGSTAQIIAGEEIEASIGVVLGLSTMAAAGLGNLVSDVAGLMLADQIEAVTKKLKWTQAPALSVAQRMMLRTRAAKFAGCAIGVSVGCILGMFPLLFLDNPPATPRPGHV